jgi:hypothetical protein
MERYYFTISTILTVVCFLMLVPAISFAQNPSTPTSEAVGISTESQFIEPKEEVIVKAESRLINLNNANITWQVNGSIVNTGVAVKEISVMSGNVGETTEVSFQADIPDRGVITRSIKINPVDIDLVWESTESFVPAFYKGKALHPGWGNIKVTAIPHITKPDSNSRYSSEELVYEWEYNNLVHGDDSGRGENTFSVGGTPRQNRVSVTIQTPQGDNIASESITIPVVDPGVVLYPDSNTEGLVLSRSFSNANINQTSLDNTNISVQPYYFLAEKPSSEDIGYDWSIGGDTTDNSSNTLDFSSERDFEQTSVSVEVVDNSHLLFPTKETTVDINF